MRRTSERALTLVKLAADSGLDILPTRLETWGQEGMLWPDGTPDERKLEYLRLLDRLTGHRKSRDRAVRIMAIHGCPVERLRSAISWGDPDPTFDAILDGADEVTRDEVIRDTVDGYMGSPLGEGTFKQATTEVLTSVTVSRAKLASESRGRNEADWETIKERAIGNGASIKEAEKIANSKVKPDAPEIFRRQVGRQLMQASLTGEMYDPEVVEAFTGLDEAEVEVFAGALPTLAAEVNHLAETMPLDEIAAICRVARTTITPEALGPKSDRFSDDDLDEIAAMKALGDYALNRHMLRSFAEQCGLDLTAADAFLRHSYGLPVSASFQPSMALLAHELNSAENDGPPST